MQRREHGNEKLMSKWEINIKDAFKKSMYLEIKCLLGVHFKCLFNIIKVNCKLSYFSNKIFNKHRFIIYWVKLREKMQHVQDIINIDCFIQSKWKYESGEKWKPELSIGKLFLKV